MFGIDLTYWAGLVEPVNMPISDKIALPKSWLFNTEGCFRSLEFKTLSNLFGPGTIFLTSVNGGSISDEDSIDILFFLLHLLDKAGHSSLSSNSF